MPKLHVNVDHVATVREARQITDPDPVDWAVRAVAAGATGITCHLRKDRRHIQDDDVVGLRKRISTLLNLECSLDPEMVAIAMTSGADEVCLVPENRAEVTTEGGLDVASERLRLTRALPLLRERDILISLFVDPDTAQLEAAAELEADYVELHTGSYANALGSDRDRELARLFAGAERAHALGLRVNAGHGLNLENTAPIVALPHLEELNIGHSIVARALTVGVGGAVQEMLQLIESAGSQARGTRA